MGASKSRLHGGVIADRGVAIGVAAMGAGRVSGDPALARGYCAAVRSSVDHSAQYPVDFWLLGRMSTDDEERTLPPALKPVLRELQDGRSLYARLMKEQNEPRTDADTTLLVYLASFATKPGVPLYLVNLHDMLAARRTSDYHMASGLFYAIP